MNKKKKRGDSLPSLKKKAWAIFSRIVRQIHIDNNGQCSCVTCGRWQHWKEAHAGHFVAKNRGGALWFDCRNVHVQCAYCNTYLHGNLIQYTKYMINLYGEEEVERLQSLAGPYKRSRADFYELIDHLKLCEGELTNSLTR